MLYFIKTNKFDLTCVTIQQKREIGKTLENLFDEMAMSNSAVFTDGKFSNVL